MAPHRPGKAMQNAFVKKSLRGRLRGELLNDMLLSSLAAAGQAINEWNEGYNYNRPYSAIGNIPPAPLSTDFSFSPLKTSELQRAILNSLSGGNNSVRAVFRVM
jgi:hypothetical protein